VEAVSVPLFDMRDVVILMRDVELDGVVFPEGTEAVIVELTDDGCYRIELFEPKRVCVCVEQSWLSAANP
jgi:hypothetical protein